MSEIYKNIYMYVDLCLRYIKYLHVCGLMSEIYKNIYMYVDLCLRYIKIFTCMWTYV